MHIYYVTANNYMIVAHFIRKGGSSINRTVAHFDRTDGSKWSGLLIDKIKMRAFVKCIRYEGIDHNMIRLLPIRGSLKTLKEHKKSE